MIYNTFKYHAFSLPSQGDKNMDTSLIVVLTQNEGHCVTCGGGIQLPFKSCNYLLKRVCSLAELSWCGLLFQILITLCVNSRVT